MDAMTDRPFSAADFRRRAVRETGPFGGDELGDHSLNPDLRDLILGNTLRDAAVMIAVVRPWSRGERDPDAAHC